MTNGAGLPAGEEGKDDGPTEMIIATTEGGLATEKSNQGVREFPVSSAGSGPAAEQHGGYVLLV